MLSITDSLGTWVPQVQGQYINVDGAYGAQCWDLAAHWSTFLGLPVINTGGAGRWPGWAGNMVDAFPQTPEIAAAYTLHGPNETGQPGDIVVWGDSFWYYPATHVAVLVADKGNQLTCMSQNSTPPRPDNPYPNASSGPTTIQSLPRQGLIGFIRPNVGGLAYSGTTTPTTSEEDDLMATPEQRQELIKDLLDHHVDQAGGGVTSLRALLSEARPHVNDIIRVVEGIPEATLNAKIPRGGGQPGETSLASVASWHDAHIVAIIDSVSKATGADVGTIRKAVLEGLAEGVTIKVTVEGKEAA